MNVKEIWFKYDDLTINLESIHAMLGYPDTALPAPFDEYLEEVIGFAREVQEIRAVYRRIEKVQVLPGQGVVVANGLSFQVGKTVCKELKNSEELIFYVCTAGKSISDRSTVLLQGEDPAKGYIYDQVGIFITEAAGERMLQLIQEELPEGSKTTNRYSPGYCHWEVADQHQLFSLFPQAPCGVTLTASALMTPVKSISGVIGIGRSVTYREYPCALCLSVNCVYRRVS
jgi:hypothetical protein